MATIAGSTLLTASVLSDHRAETQGVADMAMGIAGAAGGIVSGIVVGTVGFAVLSVAGVLFTAGLFALLLWRAVEAPDAGSDDEVLVMSRDEP
jgi:MFS family permease